eukprot:4657822-Lingulodinium_polyedra.AAC.1
MPVCTHLRMTTADSYRISQLSGTPGSTRATIETTRRQWGGGKIGNFRARACPRTPAGASHEHDSRCNAR